MSPAPTPPLRPGRSWQRATAPIPCLMALLAWLLAPVALAAEPEPSAPAAAAAPDPAPIEPPLIETPEVTVTSTRSERDVLDVPGNVTVISREQIEESGAANLPELLRREAGIYVSNTTGNREGYSVESRGFNNGGGNGSSTLVLIDGRRANRPGNDNTDWSFIPMDNVERIEIVRGPASAAWGDNAIGGVIQIVTRHGQRKKDGVEAVVRGKVGNLEVSGGTLFADGRHGPLSASLFLEHDFAGYYRDQSEFDAQSVEGSMGIDLQEWGRLSFKGGYSDTERERPGTLTKQEERADRRQAQPGSGDDEDTARFRYVEMPLDLFPAEGLKIRLMPYYDRRTDNALVTSPGNPSTGAGPSRFSSSSEERRIGLTSHFSYEAEILGIRSLFSAGADFRWERVKRKSLFTDLTGFFPPFPSDSVSHRNTWGAFLETEIWPLESLQIAAGVRRDSVDSYVRISEFDFTGGFTDNESLFDDRSKWSPRASISWHPVAWGSTYFSWSRGFRFPNIDEQFDFFGISELLRPESSENVEVGLKLRHRLGSFNLALYHMDVDEEIFFNPNAGDLFCPFPSGPCGSNVNLDRVVHQGLEVSGSLLPVDWFELYFSYSLEDVEVRRDQTTLGARGTSLAGERMPINPVNRGTIGSKVWLPAGFEGGFNINLVGQRILANDIPRQQEKLDAYVTLDARLAWKHDFTEWLRVEVEGAVYNITDKEYSEFGGVSTLNGRVGSFPSPERNYVTSARITLRR